MRARSIVAWGGAAVLGVGLALPGTPVAAAPSSAAAAATAATDQGGRGAGTATRVPPSKQATVVRRAAAAPSVADPLEMPTSYPYQPALRFYRDNPDDAAKTPRLLGHPDLAPQVTEWMEQSNRISAQVIGQSTQGRDLYLVTVTAPESEAETAQQTEWREEIRENPVTAAADPDLVSQYKTPVWFSANIHGNEWEGTDAVMRYIDYLVDSPIADVSSILRNNRLYFSLSLNPDGRTNATRATALGLDPNRDMITNTTPEATSFVRTAQAIQPIYSADLHGYTGVLQVEPCGPPHGSNYEYDLYLPHNYAMALKVEADVVAANIPNNTYRDPATGRPTTTNTGFIQIPYRDIPDGWDDFPPIFTAQYAAFHGAASSTVELPLTRGGTGATAGRQTPERAVVNVAVGTQTVRSMVDYMTVATNARDMLRNQIEVFRRGVAGEPKTALTLDNIAAVPGPAQWKPLWDVADNQEPVTLPRAYVIPVGDDQRSASDAADLVEALLFHDVEVSRLTAPATVGGTTYPAGSYVVDMHQPLRGLANSLLDLGENISAKVPSMYDISAWSYSYLWGATVDKVGATTDGPIGSLEPVTAVTPAAAAPDSGYLTFDVAGVRDLRLLNALLEEEVPVSMLDDGSVVVAPADADAVVDAAAAADVLVEEATEEDLDALDDEATKGLADVAIAYVGTQDDRLALTELGFDDLVNVTATTINNAATAGTATGLESADLLWVGGSLSFPTGAAGDPGRAAVQGFVNSGHSIVGRSANAFNVAVANGLLTGMAVNGNGSGNGIVAVDTPETGLLADYPQSSAFIYPATWFTGLGADDVTEQSYAAVPLLAGHWRPGTVGGNPAANGPANAAGQPAVVSSEAASGAKAFVFGTSVFFRTHPKGGMSQAGRAVLWASPDGPEVPAPSASTVTLTADTPVAYPGDVDFDVTVLTGAAEAATGTVDLVAGGDVVGTGTLTGGETTITLESPQPGTASYVALFRPDTAALEPAQSEPVSVTVTKAISRTSLKVVEKVGRRVTLDVGLRIAGLPSVGRVVVTDGGAVVRRMNFGGADVKRITLRLPLGVHQLRAAYAGTPQTEVSNSATRRVVIRG